MKSKNLRFLLILSFWVFFEAPGHVQCQETPVVKYVLLEDGAVTTIHLKAGYTTSIRLPEEVSSVVVGNPLAFKAEHSAAEARLVFVKPITTRATESNALITTKSGQEINLHLISGGRTASSAQVDFMVEFRRPQSLLITPPDGPSIFVLPTKSIRPSQLPGRQELNEVEPIACLLALQQAVASPAWVGGALEVSVGESSEVDHEMLVGFSVLNNSRQPIELLPPQIVLNGRSGSARAKQIKADPIGITDYRLTKQRLEPGERADGVVVFERPTFKESMERLELEVAEAGKVDHPVRVSVSFVATRKGVSDEAK